MPHVLLMALTGKAEPSEHGVGALVGRRFISGSAMSRGLGGNIADVFSRMK